MIHNLGARGGKRRVTSVLSKGIQSRAWGQRCGALWMFKVKRVPSAPRCWALALRARSMASLRGRIQASAPAKQFRSQGTARGPVGSPESQEMEVKFQSLCAK